IVAVANRPPEPFETQVPMPDWQLTPEEELYGDTAIDANAVQPLVDANGMPINPPPTEPGTPQQQQPAIRPDGTGEPSQEDLDQAFPPQQQQQTRPPPQPQPRPGEPRSAPPSEPPQPRPNVT